ncbi:NADPH-dependent FMN reductase [Aeromonas sobria]|uniref:NADPH-dependent FMN reductase n=1 Tax=Aeromonas sobria TaxID=646 RepID=UPI000C6EEA82|nr:NAD(P)H-dependent oxidoreductase [Aeromonas sobria]PKQ71372.1 hypothetical protein CJF47_20695 [Aeromonas sobria]
MKLTIISASQRKNSASLLISNGIANVNFLRSLFNEVAVMDLANMNIPLWDETFLEENENSLAWHRVSTTLKLSDAFIFVVPEWSGMAPSALMNLLMIAKGEELGHKPCLIIANSVSNGGCNPVSILRGYTYKNNHICYIPDHIIIRDNRAFIDSLHDINESTENLFGRIRYTLNLLHGYAVSLKKMRDDNIIDFTNYPYGMS